MHRAMGCYWMECQTGKAPEMGNRSTGRLSGGAGGFVVLWLPGRVFPSLCQKTAALMRGMKGVRVEIPVDWQGVPVVFRGSVPAAGAVPRRFAPARGSAG